ncbi:MAG: hypothetical protein Tsb009_38920 [Planctomycetaceae bacterium]
MTTEPIDDAHQLIPDELAKTIPKLYATQNDSDPIARVKLFTPDASWTWFVTEYDPQEHLCFGFVIGMEREFGYFSLAELEEVRGPLGLQIERDLAFTPRPVSECQS